MSTELEIINYLWKDITNRQVCLPAEIWITWGENLGGFLNKIHAIASRELDTPLAIEDVETINIYVHQLVRSFKIIRRGSGSESFVKAGVIFLDPAVKDLMAHYVGNDLYKIALMVDVYGEDSTPLSSEIRMKILSTIDSIYAFIERLKRSTRLK